MQFQSPVSLRLLPTLPACQQLKGPSGSQTDRSIRPSKLSGSSTHRVLASTNASSLAAIKLVNERNQSLFNKIGETVNHISAALREGSIDDSGVAEAAGKAQDLSDAVMGIIRPPQPPRATGGSSIKEKAVILSDSSRDSAVSGRCRKPKLPGRNAALKSAAAPIDLPPSSAAVNPVIDRIEKLLVSCGTSLDHSNSGRGCADKAMRGTFAVPSRQPVIVCVRHVPLGYVGACCSITEL
jgi:hypothetical protein